MFGLPLPCVDYTETEFSAPGRCLPSGKGVIYRFEVQKVERILKLVQGVSHRGGIDVELSD